MRDALRLAIGLVLAVSGASAWAAKETFHRWVDANGTVHYSKDAPPDIKTDSVNVAGERQVAEDVEAAPTIAPEAAVDDAKARLDAADAAICERARSSLRVLETERPVVRMSSATGERRVLSADEISAELVVARREVERTCAPVQESTE